MARITCYRCFAQFSPRKLFFKCPWHASIDAELGKQPFKIFPWSPPLWKRRPPQNAECPDCARETSYRVCPRCKHDLPHYVGRVTQQIVAVCGCNGSGKTVYHWALLHQLREKVGRHADSPAAAMFEDDSSLKSFETLDRQVRARRQLPSATQDKDQKAGKWEPMIVRLLKRSTKHRVVHTNLIFYDHAGELIEALTSAEYLRYLAHAAAIIYLVDPLDGRDMAREGLNAVVQRVRTELGIRAERPIDKPLAIAVSKSDETLFPTLTPRVDRSALLPDYHEGLSFWRKSRRHRTTRVEESSRHCETYLNQDLGLHNLTSLAQNSFRTVRYFAISSLNGALNSQRRLQRTPEPLAVEHPLFWLMSELS